MILVTGASGFIGTALCKRLVNEKISVRGVGRSQSLLIDCIDYISYDLEHAGDIDYLCQGVDTIIHLAGRAHVLKETSVDPIAAFKSANLELTMRLAKAALRQGVRRFIFLSSIGVNANETVGQPLTEDSPCEPIRLYGYSKLEAERALVDLTKASGMELVIVRPPLVYDGDAPGNFKRLMTVILKGIPLPFLTVHNSRSMIARDNLIDFLICCVNHPRAANQVFLVSDGIDLSLPQIISCLAQGMGVSPKLFPFPTSILRVALACLGKKEMYSQLCSSLSIDSGKSRAILEWTPPVQVTEALINAGRHFARANNDKCE
ncbi:MAG: NAD-dependent epimerase/dehydratase family protein [Pseudomonas putida]|jgi:nucleoside-diphosphate-sugar epimerase|nr:NAD-dependent epimerase/dehydratase family protein [Pseudomonas putida]